MSIQSDPHPPYANHLWPIHLQCLDGRTTNGRQSYKRPIQIGIGVALLCALPFVVLAILVAAVNPNRFKPRIEAAVQDAPVRGRYDHARDCG